MLAKENIGELQSCDRKNENITTQEIKGKLQTKTLTLF